MKSLTNFFVSFSLLEVLLELHIKLHIYHIVVVFVGCQATVVYTHIFGCQHHVLANPVVGANLVVGLRCRPFGTRTIQVVASLGIQLLADDWSDYESIHTVCLVACCLVDGAVVHLSTCLRLGKAITLAVDILRAESPVVGGILGTKGIAVHRK